MTRTLRRTVTATRTSSRLKSTTTKPLKTTETTTIKSALKTTASKAKAKAKAPAKRTKTLKTKPAAEIPIDRPASPTATNAPLLTPPESSTAFVGVDKAATSTTSEILETALAHLKKVGGERMQMLIQNHECTVFSAEALGRAEDPFQSLASSIISQQVSGAAAKSIKAKFVALFSAELDDANIDFPTPTMVLAREVANLRTAGLSGRKAEYMHSLAEKFRDGELSAEILVAADDEEVVQRLTSVRGLGVWSAEMFMLFTLKRLDVFSVGDLGIQRGMAAFAGKDVKKLKGTGKGKWKYMSEADMKAQSEKFRPFRSVFMWYMWKMSDTEVEALTVKK